MLMYQTKQIYYKTIFKSQGESETVEYKAVGVFHKEEKMHLYFDTKDGTIHIIYDDNGVELKHGQSVLYFQYDKEVWNQYQIPYGELQLKTKLLLFEANEQRIKMKYELYDFQGLISTVYMFVQMLPYQYFDSRE